MLDDLPRTVDKPTWSGLERLADQIAQLLWRAGDGTAAGLAIAQTPVLLTGDWGSGKTTLLLMLKDKLESGGVDSGYGEMRHVWFDAWRYEGKGSLLPALVHAVWRTAEGRRRSRDTPVLALIRGHGAKALGAALTIGARLVPTLTGLNVPVAAAAEAVLDAVGDLSNAVEASERLVGSELPPPADPLDVLVGSLGDMVRTGWPELKQDDPASWPLVFVDDLDRCAPERTLKLVEQLRALLAVQGSTSAPLPLRFVLAMDRDLLVKAVSRKFDGLHGYDGHRYIEKVFPLAFAVPRPSLTELDTLVASLFDRAAELHRLTDGPKRHLPDLRQVVTSVFQREVFANPRLAIRCINKYLLITAWESGIKQRDWRFDAQEDHSLVAWIAACERWPVLRRIIGIDEEHWWVRLEVALREGVDVGPDPQASAIMAQPGAGTWLRGELLHPGTPKRVQFQAANRRMREWGL